MELHLNIISALASARARASLAIETRLAARAKVDTSARRSTRKRDGSNRLTSESNLMAARLCVVGSLHLDIDSRK